MTEGFKSASHDKGVFDLESFRERMMDDEDLMKEVAVAMIEDTPQQIAILKQLLAEKNLPEAGKAGHKIKGGASNLCCGELERIAFLVEQAGKTGDQIRLQASAEELFSAWNRLEIILRQIWN